MGYGNAINTDDRAKSTAAVIAIHSLVGYGLLTGMGLDIVQSASESLNVISITAPLKPEQVPEPEPAAVEAKASEKEAAAAAPNREADPTQIAAPKPVVEIPRVNPVITAPKSKDGDKSQAGAAKKVGPGTGAAGQGSGFGSGAGGDGTGGGIAVPSRLQSGRITRKDYPPAAKADKAGGIVIVHFTVRPDGRVADCRVKRSSGRADLDRTTCQLIEQRFRFDPARDHNGKAVSSLSGWKQDWWLERSGRRVTD